MEGLLHLTPLLEMYKTGESEKESGLAVAYGERGPGSHCFTVLAFLQEDENVWSWTKVMIAK